MSKFNNTMPQIFKTQCDSGQKSACLMVLLTTSFFTFVWRWWRNQLKTATFTQGARAWVGSGRGWYVFMDSSLRVQLGWLLQGPPYDIFTMSVCVGFCHILSMNNIVKPWTIWHFTSYLSTRCLKERSILTLSSTGHSNWKKQQIPPRISGKKTTCIQLTNFHTFFFSLWWLRLICDNLNCYNPMAFQRCPSAGAAPSASTKEREAHQQPISYIDGTWWLFSLCFGWNHMKSTFGFTTSYHLA